VGCRRGGHQDDEGTGRTADLMAAAAEQRDEKTTDNRGIETPVRCHTGGDRNRHGKRQGDDRDGQTGNGIGPQPVEVIAFAKHVDGLRYESVGHAIPPMAQLRSITASKQSRLVHR